MEKKVRLLIIDDDTTILKLMVNVLDKDKFEILTLTDADNIVKEIKGSCPDIILLDIKLQGTTGVEAIHLVKEDKSINKIPVVAFTSYSMKGDKVKFLKMGYDGYIAKPINTRTIADEIIGNLKNRS